MNLKNLILLVLLKFVSSEPDPNVNVNVDVHVDVRDGCNGCTLNDPELGVEELVIDSSNCDTQYYPCTSSLPYTPLTPYTRPSDTVNTSNCEDIQFRLYTSTSGGPQIIIAGNKPSVEPLNSSLPLLVVVHGFRENADNSDWMHAIKNKTLEKSSTDVILVQWTKYADVDIIEYCKAVQSTRCVGYRLAKLLAFLQSENKLSSNTHIIGFSLGAQIAGTAGFKFKGLSRITGLDPAGPGFYQAGPEWRLDATDASFVDIIHTNGGCPTLAFAGPYGYYNHSGHVDFYVDGGRKQKGCSATYIGCSHGKAHEYYVKSLYTTDPIYGYRCQEEGQCNNNETNILGYGVKHDPAGVFYSNSTT